MDGGAADTGRIKIYKLTETNFHEWRQLMAAVYIKNLVTSRALPVGLLSCGLRLSPT